jgi:hypothetical protein
MKINYYFFYLLVFCIIYVCFFNKKESFSDVTYDYNLMSNKQKSDKKINKAIYKYVTYKNTI